MAIVNANILTTDTTLVTVPAGKKYALTTIIVCNNGIDDGAGTNNTKVDIHVIPSGDSLGNTNLVAKTLSIAATDSYQLYTGGEKLLLANGDTIQVTASAATGINSVVSFTAI